MAKDNDIHFTDVMIELTRMHKSFIDKCMPEIECFELRTSKHEHLGMCAVVRVSRVGLNNNLTLEFTEHKEQLQYRAKDNLSNTSKIGIIQQFIRVENK